MTSRPLVHTEEVINMLTRTGGTGKAACDTGDATEAFRLVGETRRNAEDG